MKGAFVISREIFDNPIWNDIQKFRIFFYILGNAVFSEEGIKKGNIHIKRGQFLRSYRNLQKDLEYVENRSIKQYSLSTIKRKINQLIEENRLKIEDTELGTLFTICNYDRYQVLNNYKQELGTQRERRENADGTERERSWNNNKNVKNVKKENIPYGEIVDYLNQKTGKKFKPTTKKTKDVIRARWNEGHRLEDFKKVIDVCSSKWSGVTFSNGQLGDDYLQPSTLFSNKFEERLNWSIEKSSKEVDSFKSDSVSLLDEVGGM